MFLFTEKYMIQLTASGLTGASGVCVHDPVVEDHRRAHGPAPILRLTQRESRATGRPARFRRVIWTPAQVRFSLEKIHRSAMLFHSRYIHLLSKKTASNAKTTSQTEQTNCC